MSASTLIGSLFAALALSGAPLPAQIVPAGNPESFRSGELYAKVFLAVGDGAGPAMPIRGVHVLLIAANGDTTRLVTDGAGAAAAYVPQGEYRLETRDPVYWRGREYYWRVPLTVESGMRDLVLSARNAAATTPSLAGGTTQSEFGGDVVRSRDARLAARPVRTDRRTIEFPAGVRWEVFEQAFDSAAVVGTDLPLPRTLRALMFDRPGETRQLDGVPADWSTLPDSALVGLLSKARRIRP